MPKANKMSKEEYKELKSQMQAAIDQRNARSNVKRARLLAKRGSAREGSPKLKQLQAIVEAKSEIDRLLARHKNRKAQEMDEEIRLKYLSIVGENGLPDFQLRVEHQPTSQETRSDSPIKVCSTRKTRQTSSVTRSPSTNTLPVSKKTYRPFSQRTGREHLINEESQPTAMDLDELHSVQYHSDEDANQDDALSSPNETTPHGDTGSEAGCTNTESSKSMSPVPTACVIGKFRSVQEKADLFEPIQRSPMLGAAPPDNAATPTPIELSTPADHEASVSIPPAQTRLAILDDVRSSKGRFIHRDTRLRPVAHTKVKRGGMIASDGPSIHMAASPAARTHVSGVSPISSPPHQSPPRQPSLHHTLPSEAPHMQPIHQQTIRSPPPASYHLSPPPQQGNAVGIVCSRDPSFGGLKGISFSPPSIQFGISGTAVLRRDITGWRRVMVVADGEDRCWLVGEEEARIRKLLKDGYHVKARGKWVKRSKKYDSWGGREVVWKAELDWSVVGNQG
ncbi:hypothetical protein BJ508DRAFT_306324 [Ascobolus immersus RN42]|uniref:Uncharacterized protein n=1 Tax=Ascobolus immersus RN42 TaxID=1160509 RepID=A0A3N4I6K8_ASCIM|nr:hypothetical protein BJ508DRAFT_306324 [Ascobolus immersus RN42]